jgi:hypothetical protein
MMRRAHVALGSGLLLLLGLMYACRPGVGDPCACEGDCERGLVCAVPGRVLRPGECAVQVVGPNQLGECVEAADVPDDPDDLPTPPLFFDLGTRRDFDSGQPPDVGSSGTEGETEDTGDTTGTEGETGATSFGTDTGTAGNDGMETSTGSTSTDPDDGASTGESD